ncbi:TPA: hypothetical protein ACNV0S_003733 [Proteus mirabilis]|uniref:hypothetical protein n=1 Tax=Proteus hauseri TaxID=183417 RepID=UPI001009643E|nr:hypothetical protein [Proteus hauseri]QAV22372.1 hypothetical protein PH4a_03030 [Proteus hauseri]
MSNRYYEIEVFGRNYQLIARESSDTNLTFKLDDNSKFPPIYNVHAKNKLPLKIKMPNGFYNQAYVSRAPFGMFIASFI